MGRPGRGRGSLVVLAILLAVLILPTLTVPPEASAATTVTSLAASPVGTSVAGPPPAVVGVALVGVALVKMTNRLPGATTVAGRQTPGTLGLAGTPRPLPACRVGPCVDLFRPAGAAPPVVGHWALEVRLTVVQPPARTGTASGFAVEVAIQFAAGWSVEWGYLSSGTTRARTAQSVTVELWVDLGTPVRPILLGAPLLFDACSTARSCP
jgi:hypothetical protein